MATSGSSGRKAEERGKLGWSARAMRWTLNNYSDEEVDRLREYGRFSCRYQVFGYEIAPTTGTPHLQGYTSWDNKKSADKFIAEISPKLSVRTCDESAQTNANYCKKKESKDPTKNPSYEEFGEMPRQGKRTDWCGALEKIKNGQAIEDVIDDQPQLLPCIRALENYKSKQLKPKNRPVEVIVLWGDAGSGKSRWAYETYPDLYSKSPNKWWDGYTGQTTILLDDYYGYIPFTELLNVLDRYPYHAEIKGGHVWAQWTTVILTSNKPPNKWYAKGWPPELQRRISKIFFYSIDAPPKEIQPSSLCEETWDA